MQVDCGGSAQRTAIPSAEPVEFTSGRPPWPPALSPLTLPASTAYCGKLTTRSSMRTQATIARLRPRTVASARTHTCRLPSAS